MSDNNSDITESTIVLTDVGDAGIGVLTLSGDADAIFAATPLMMIELIAQSSERGHRIDRALFEAIKRNADHIKDVPAKSVNLQLQRIIESQRPAKGFRLLDMSGLLKTVFPELTALKGVETIEGNGHKDNFDHTLKVLDNVAHRSSFASLRWVALLHDIGKPKSKKYEPGLGWTFRNHDYLGAKMVRQLLRRMKIFNLEKIDYISKMVGLHMRPQQIGEEGVTDSAVRRMKTDAGDGDDVQELMLLAEADLTSKNPMKVRRVLNTFAKVRQRLEQIIVNDTQRAIPDIINGYEIMETFGIGPTPELGKIKADVCNFANTEGLTHAEAYQYMLDKAYDYNLQPKENVEELRVSFEEQYQNRMAEREHKQADATAKKLERDIALGRVKNQ